MNNDSYRSCDNVSSILNVNSLIFMKDFTSEQRVTNTRMAVRSFVT